jgi:hypothetical protein
MVTTDAPLKVRQQDGGMIAKLKETEILVVVFFAMTCWAIMLQHRCVSLPFYLLFIGLCLSRRWHKRTWLIVATVAAFFLSTFSPVDLYVPGWSGPIFGNEKSGTRLVRQAMGLGGGSRGARKYGECVGGGCFAQVFCDAKWMLVLDWTSGTNRPANETENPTSSTNSTNQVTSSGG